MGMSHPDGFREFGNKPSSKGGEPKMLGKFYLHDQLLPPPAGLGLLLNIQ